MKRIISIFVFALISSILCAQTVLPDVKTRLQPLGVLGNGINGSSGLMRWNGEYWTQQDHDTLQLYRLDSLSGAVLQVLRLSHSVPADLEEIGQDSTYLYFADIGNNCGDRTDLHFLRYNKKDCKAMNAESTTPFDSITQDGKLYNPHAQLCNSIIPDTIWFQYEDQHNFKRAPLKTDFDCEAFVVGQDSIYLFTKQWTSRQTVCYALPKVPGRHVAVTRHTCPVGGLVTGAVLFPNRLVLCGYSRKLKPMLWVFEDFDHYNFFHGTMRRVKLNRTMAQIEGIAGSHPNTILLTSERFRYRVIHLKPRLWRCKIAF